MLNLIFGRRVTLSTKAMTVKQRQPVRNISLIKPNQNMFMFLSFFFYISPPPPPSSIKTFVVSSRLCSLQSRGKKLPKPVDLSSVLDFNKISTRPVQNLIPLFSASRIVPGFTLSLVH
ncbi:unnamed protein product [Brassica oleracea]